MRSNSKRSEAKIKRNTMVKLLGDKNFTLNESNLNISLMIFNA